MGSFVINIGGKYPINKPLISFSECIFTSQVVMGLYSTAMTSGISSPNHVRKILITLIWA